MNSEEPTHDPLTIKHPSLPIYATQNKPGGDIVFSFPEPAAKDWLTARTRVETVGDLKKALDEFPDDMDIMGTFDGGYGIADFVYLGRQRETFVIDVEQDEQR